MTNVPEGYSTITPWVIVRGAARFLDFLRDVFGAEETARIHNEDGVTIGHAEARIGDSVVMMFDAGDGWPDTPAFLRLYVPDVDAVIQRAIAAGGRTVTEPTDLFFGERVARVRDPWGNLWWLHQRYPDVAPEELARRAQEEKYVDAMRYVQASLDREMSGR